MKYSNEAIFCAKYLRDKGFLTNDILADLISKADKLDKNYVIKEIPDGYWHSIAEALRPLWPAGSKDGKYEWRGSIESLSTRLEALWRVRNLDTYSVDTCVEVANQYLSRFRNNAKYMQVLQYFILKQKKIVMPDGKVKYVNQSVFADMLESANDDVLKQQEWNDLLENATLGEGRLV